MLVSKSNSIEDESRYRVPRRSRLPDISVTEVMVISPVRTSLEHSARAVWRVFSSSVLMSSADTPDILNVVVHVTLVMSAKPTIGEAVGDGDGMEEGWKDGNGVDDVGSVDGMGDGTAVGW